jgi:hypothetical protein
MCDRFNLPVRGTRGVLIFLMFFFNIFCVFFVYFFVVFSFCFFVFCFLPGPGRIYNPTVPVNNKKKLKKFEEEKNGKRYILKLVGTST